jgi:hypothetical protein
MTCANDWTKEMSTKGFPELKQLFGLLGAPDNVMLSRGEHFPHNYNAVSRSAFYTWLNRHFNLGQTAPVIERDYHRLSRAELTVWDAEHPAPPSADPETERQLLKMWHEDAASQLAKLAEEEPDKYREILRTGWDVVLDGGLDDAGQAGWEMKDKQDKGDWIQMAGLLRNSSFHEELPAVFCYPKNWNGQTVIWLTSEGKAGLFESGGSLKADAQKLVASGVTVLGLDLLYQGEFLTEGKPLAQTPRVKNPREAGAYTFGYNPAVFVQRVHDVLTAVRYIRGHDRPSKRLSLIALDGMGPIAAAARAQAGGAFDRAAIHVGSFRFGQVLDLRSPDFLPGGAKYGDVPALLALGSGELQKVENAGDSGEAVDWIVK